MSYSQQDKYKIRRAIRSMNAAVSSNPSYYDRSRCCSIDYRVLGTTVDRLFSRPSFHKRRNIYDRSRWSRAHSPELYSSHKNDLKHLIDVFDKTFDVIARNKEKSEN